MDVGRFISTHKKSLWVGVIILLLIVVCTLPLYADRYQVRILISILMYVTIAVSWAMFSGTTGYMSLAPAAFFGTGVYVVAFLQEELPFPVLIVLSGLSSFVLALLVGAVTLRLKGIYFAIFTFGLVVLMNRLFDYGESRAGTSHGRYIDVIDPTVLLYTMLGLLVVTLVIAYLIRRSRWGLALLSIGGNEDAAEHMGINTTRVKVLSFAITCTFMGAAGAILSPSLLYINPTIAFGVSYSFTPILMALFGGVGQLYGPVVGAVIFGYLSVILRTQASRFYMLIFGIILVLVILFLPQGIAGALPTLLARLRRTVSKLKKGEQAKEYANT